MAAAFPHNFGYQRFPMPRARHQLSRASPAGRRGDPDHGSGEFGQGGLMSLGNARQRDLPRARRQPGTATTGAAPADPGRSPPRARGRAASDPRSMPGTLVFQPRSGSTLVAGNPWRRTGKAAPARVPGTTICGIGDAFGAPREPARSFTDTTGVYCSERACAGLPGRQGPCPPGPNQVAQAPGPARVRGSPRTPVRHRRGRREGLSVTTFPRSRTSFR